MLFSSVTFLFYFLPAVFLLSGLLPSVRWKNRVLLLASLAFYAWGEPTFLPVLIAVILVTYCTGERVARSTRERARHWLFVGVGLNLLCLGGLKYTGLMVKLVNRVCGLAGFAEIPIPEVQLPLGISFYVFQAISYLVDVHRREASPARSPTELALYVAMFPQLVAGPIVRYQQVAARLRSRRVTLARAAYGARLFIIGLAQKTLIADQLAPIANAGFELTRGLEPSFVAAWTGVIAYSLQICFDFSGYSNMAIGLGLALGFRFPRNFRLPYAAESVTDFWRRWHISLSRWFRDYLYIPLGGNRDGAARTYRNLIVVFLLCGLWHGASANFLIWGAHHGAFLVLERSAFGGRILRLNHWLRRAYTLFVVALGWVWFRADGTKDALRMFRSMFGLSDAPEFALNVLNALTPLSLLAFAVGIVACVPYATRMVELFFAQARARVTYATPMLAQDACFVVLLWLSISFIAADAYSPFLYFRF